MDKGVEICKTETCVSLSFANWKSQMAQEKLAVTAALLLLVLTSRDGEYACV